MNYSKVLQTSSLHRFSTATLLGLCLYVAGHSPARADLTLIQDLNEVQLELAEGIQNICPKLGALSNPTTMETQLYWACTAMIHTSNAIQGEGPDGFSLGLTANELRMILGDIAHEETTTNGDAFTEVSQTQFASVASRLRGLRQGGNRSVSKYRFNINNTLVNSNWITNVTETDNNFAALNSPFSYYINGNFNNGDKEESAREHAFDFNTSGLTLGADYRLGGSGFIGAAAGYSRLNMNIDYLEQDNGTEIDSFDFSLYGTYFVKNAFFNAMFGVGNNGIESRREVPSFSGLSLSSLSLSENETLFGYTDANALSLSLSGGSDNTLKSLTFSHYGQFDMSRVYIAQYNEEGDSPLLLHVNEEVVDSTSFTLGTQISHVGSYGFGVVTEMLRLEWRHEFENESRKIEAYYVYDPFEEKSLFAAPSDNPDRDFFSLGVGITTVLPMGFQVFAYYENIINLKHYTNQSFTVGIRMENF